MNHKIRIALAVKLALVLAIPAFGQAPVETKGIVEYALSTNVADYADLGTLNVEASLGFNRHWSVNAGARYNPFELGSKQRAFALGARYWPWYVFSGWWLSGQAQYQEYSVIDSETSEGDRYGGGLSGGYSRMLTEHLNLDIGFGLWAGYEVYSVYACERCGRLTDSGTKFFFRTNDIILALTYVF